MNASHGDLVREETKMLVLLYEFPAETWLAVYRRLDIEQEVLPSKSNTKMVSIGTRVEPRTQVRGHMRYMF